MFPFDLSEEKKNQTTNQVSKLPNLNIPPVLFESTGERLGDFLDSKLSSPKSSLAQTLNEKYANRATSNSPAAKKLLHTYQSKELPNFADDRIGSILKQKVIEQRESETPPQTSQKLSFELPALQPIGTTPKSSQNDNLFNTSNNSNDNLLSNSPTLPFAKFPNIQSSNSGISKAVIAQVDPFSEETKLPSLGSLPTYLQSQNNSEIKLSTFKSKDLLDFSIPAISQTDIPTLGSHLRSAIHGGSSDHHQSNNSPASSSLFPNKRKPSDQPSSSSLKKFKAEDESIGNNNLVEEDQEKKIPFPALSISSLTSVKSSNNPMEIRKKRTIKYQQLVISSLYELNLQTFLKHFTNFSPFLHKLPPKIQLDILQKLHSKKSEKLSLQTIQLFITPNLTHLDLTGSSHLTEENLLHIFRSIEKSSPNLSNINLTDCTEVSSAVLEMIGRCCPKLQHLNVSKCHRVADQGMEVLFQYIDTSKLISLKTVGCFLFTNQMIKIFTSSISELSSADEFALESVDFSFCQEIDDTGVSLLTTCCSNLKEMILNYCSSLTKKSILSISQYCKKLKVLHLSSCSNLDDIAIKSISINCPYLESINISNCPNVTTAGIDYLSQNCKELTAVDFSHCDKISDFAIFQLAGNCPLLRKVDFTNLKITSESVDSLVSRCKLLQSVNLSGTGISDSTLLYITYFSDQIDELDISFCRKLSKKAIEAFICRCINITKISLWGHRLSPQEIEALKKYSPYLSIQCLVTVQPLSSLRQ